MTSEVWAGEPAVEICPNSNSRRFVSSHSLRVLYANGLQMSSQTCDAELTPLCCTGQKLHGQFSWLCLVFSQGNCTSYLLVYQVPQLSMEWCTKWWTHPGMRCSCCTAWWWCSESWHGWCGWDGCDGMDDPQPGGWDGVDVMSDLGWLINSSPMLGPSGEVDWGTSGATNCGSALLLQSWGPTLPGAKFLWGLLVLCGLGDFLNAKGVFYGWVVFLGQSFSRFLPKRRQFFSRCLFSVPLHPFFHLPQEPCAQPTAAKAGPAWPAVLSRANQTWISKSTFFLVLQRGIWIGQGNWTIVTPSGFHVPVSETGQGRE